MELAEVVPNEISQMENGWNICSSQESHQSTPIKPFFAALQPQKKKAITQAEVVPNWFKWNLPNGKFTKWNQPNLHWKIIGLLP
jgi:hypothetical protein